MHPQDRPRFRKRTSALLSEGVSQKLFEPTGELNVVISPEVVLLATHSMQRLVAEEASLDLCFFGSSQRRIK